MRLLKSAAKRALHTAGGIHFFRAANAGKFRILMYHRFPIETRELDWQCRYLRRYYSPVSLATIAAGLQSGVPLPANAAAITVDDGYADFYSHAWPVLRQYSIPATVYLVSGFLDGELWLWTDQVRFLIERTACPSFEGQPLTTPEQRSAAVLALYDRLNLLPNRERMAFLARMPGSLGVQLPAAAPEHDRPMSWEQVRELAAEGVEFGAHTRTHPILSRVEDEAALQDEVAGSKRRIEDELQMPVRHFCYPNGTSRDIGAAALTAVQDARFETAVTTEPGLNTRATDPHLLRRQGTDPWVAHEYFAELLAGVRGHRA